MLKMTVRHKGPFICLFWKINIFEIKFIFLGEVVFDINSFKAGNRQAFKFVFDKLYTTLCLFTNRFLNDLPASEDIVQETLLTLWNHREEMNSMAHIKAFLYMACRNASLDYIKHLKVKESYQQQLIENEITANFEYFVIAEEVEQILLKTQESLPEKCKRIFIMAMQGKDNETIALELNISVNTVKTQKKIAYKKLKDFLSDIMCLLILLRTNL